MWFQSELIHSLIAKYKIWHDSPFHAYPLASFQPLAHLSGFLLRHHRQNIDGKRIHILSRFTKVHQMKTNSNLFQVSAHLNKVKSISANAAYVFSVNFLELTTLGIFQHSQKSGTILHLRPGLPFIRINSYEFITMLFGIAFKHGSLVFKTKFLLFLVRTDPNISGNFHDDTSFCGEGL